MRSLSTVLILVPGQRTLLAERFITLVTRVELVRRSIGIACVQHGQRSVQHLVAVLVQIAYSVRTAATRSTGTILDQWLPQFAAYLVTAVCIKRLQAAVGHVHHWRVGRRAGLVVQAIVLFEVVIFGASLRSFRLLACGEKIKVSSRDSDKERMLRRNKRIIKE